MKKILIIALAGIIVTLTACRPEDTSEQQLSLQISFTGSIVQPSVPGTVGEPWTAEHRIGVFMSRATNPGHDRADTLPIFAPSNLIVDNKQFSASPGSRTTFSAIDGNPLFFSDEDTARRRFVAYRPFTTNITEDFRKPINISDQSDLAALEVLYARATRENIGYNRRHQAPIDLSFTQQLTKVVFNISNGEGVTDPVSSGLTIRITNQNLTGYMLLEDGSLITTGEPTDLVIGNHSISGETVTAKAVVFPGSTEDVMLEIINNAGETFRISFPNTEWVGSVIHTYDITLSTTAYILDLRDATWESSFVYEIWARGVKIGELCLELLRNNNVNRQAVVAYTMLPNSNRANLATGLAVDNGNFVQWNLNVTATTLANQILLSYGGGHPPITGDSLIFLTVGSSRWTTVNPGVVNTFYATLKPMLLRDERTGDAINDETTEVEYYRIVKIGTQYWIADNLRTRRFADGTPILTDVSEDDWNVRTPGVQAWSPAVALSARGGTGITLGTRRDIDDANSTEPDDITLRNTDGLVYNFPAVINFRPNGHTTAIPQGEIVDRISPNGWNVPRRAHFEILYRYIHQVDFAAGIAPPARPAAILSDFRSNETGFSARGGGQRTGLGTYADPFINASHFIMIDTYQHVPNAAQFEGRHMMTTFRINLMDGPLGTSAHFQSTSVATANYIRLIRD
ncbi:MAG: fimbrillin family protein [Bacteroidales bacterium]|nr:fimbrillin family protein [Bacteroidales bacterium]